MEEIDPKWRRHYQTLLSLRDRLEREQSDVRRDAAEPLEPHSMNPADSATDEFDHNLALSRLSAGQDALNEVNEAIKRLHNGSYGICQVSGKRIAADRLKVIPWTRFDRETEEDLERRGLVPKPQLGQLRTLKPEGTVNLKEEDSELSAEDESLHKTTPSAEHRKKQNAKPAEGQDRA